MPAMIRASDKKPRVWMLIGLSILIASAPGLLAYSMGRPGGVRALLRGALTQSQARRGPSVGEEAPDIELISLDGKSTFSLREKIGQKPLVLIFGSYT